MCKTIILAAAEQSLTEVYSSQMTPIRGKPALSWVIEDCLADESVVVVLNKDNHQTIQYIEKRYPSILIKIVDSQKDGNSSILNSLEKGLSEISNDTSCTRVILGDTLCRNVDIYSGDVILTSTDFISSERWCLTSVDCNGFIAELYDKKMELDISDKQALIGYYQFSDTVLLKQIVTEALVAGKKQLSDVLRNYHKVHKIKTQLVDTWYDLGHKAGLIKAQNHFFNSRDFNSLYADPIRGTITKISPKRQKLADEYAWYRHLPEDLKVLAPRPIYYEEKLDNAILTMEMYGYPALSELFILGNLSIEEWELIICRLFEVHKIFEEYKGSLTKENFYDLYLHKTWQRLKELQEQNPYWKQLWSYDTIIINDKEYCNIRYFEKQINEKIELLIANTSITVMHGDYCFSNILFDTNSFLCRVIDPRGRLSEQTIYGDPRYDIAKLRHSAVGGYDYAVHGLYELSCNGNKFVIKNNYPTFQERLTMFFDKMVQKFGYDLNEIKLIEALLFMSMIPLHKDSMNRQKLFYLKSVKKINELFGDEK